MSPLLAPSGPEIGHELDALLDKSPRARVLGLRAPTPGSWPEWVERRGVRFHLVWCASELEARQQLDEADCAEGGDAGLVLLTPLDPMVIGCDVMARLPRGRLVQRDRWVALRGAFKARDVDPRLRAQRWLADLLLNYSPPGGYPPAAGDVLDLETAWRAVLESTLGLPEGRADADGLLDWTLDPRGLGRFASLPEEAREAIAQRLAEVGGAAAALVLRTVACDRGADAVPLGLACGVVFGEAEPRPGLREAAVRLEALVGGARLLPKAGASLAAAARRVLGRLARDAPVMARSLQAQAALLLSDIRALDAAALSPALDAGLDARMVEAAGALAATAATLDGDDAGRAWDLVQHASRHDRAGDRRIRLDRLLMAARLARWLSLPAGAAPRSIADAARLYAADGGFADRARHALRSGDELPEVASAYAGLRDRALGRREEESRAFALLLRDWTEAGAPGTDPLPVEKLLEAVVAPLAREAPVLLLVLDGLSFAVWRALADTVAQLGWIDLQPAVGALPVAVAALPSVTEVSRASLLCGTVGRGNQAYERARFGAHPALVQAARGRPPRLFHKADLGSGPELEAAVRDALADPAQRVVGVVHNAVDAQLSGSDQIEVQWSAEALRQVTAILRAARDARRVLVVTGDHGHVVDEGTTRAPAGAGGRWREAGPPGEGEVAISGTRVLLPDGTRSLVATWSERLRNGAPHGGYHGGASPQEMLVPVAVLSAGTPPSGWIGAPPCEPAWWRGEADAAPVLAAQFHISAVPPRPRQGSARQPELFAEAAPPAPVATVLPDWIDELFRSGSYAAQRRFAGRGAPPDDQVRPLLIALAGRGGRLSRNGLAQALSLTALRVPGLVNAARRVLNLDQAQVLRFDGEDVVLDVVLLRTQFELGR